MELFDYHFHTLRSFDAFTSLFDMAKIAQKCGFSEICVTDHCEVNDLTASEYDCAGAYSDYNEVFEKFEPLKIKFGVELGQALQNKPKAEEFVNNSAYDFIIASLHNTTKYKDPYFFTKEEFLNIDINDMMQVYFEELYDCCEWGKFDVLGHLDYPLRYLNGFGFEYNLDGHLEQIKQIFSLLIEKGKGIEVNSSGIGNIGRTFPGFEIVLLYKKLGGEIITVGSDAHTADDMGKGIGEAVQMVSDAGFKFITTYDKHKPKFNKII